LPRARVTARSLAAFAAVVALLGAAPVAVVRPGPPGNPWSASDVAKLRGDLDGLLTSDPAVHGAHVGVYAIDARSGTVLFDRNASDEFQPASTLKLLVGSVALEKLGPTYRFTTKLERTGDALVLRAGGDPLLGSSDLAAAALAVRASGMTSASGIDIDASHYDTPPYPEGWVWDDFSYDYAAPLSAAAVDENVIGYSVLPGAKIGDPVQISAGRAFVEPQARCPGLVDRAVTAASGDASTIDTLTLAPGCTAIVGALPLGRVQPASIDVAVAEPVANVRGILRSELMDPARGFVLRDDAPRAEAMPVAGRLLWQHQSDPLGTFLGPAFWIPSDNFVAEQLLCEVGFVAGGAPGSTGRGLDVERAWLAANGIDSATTTLADGSGLSQYDRITPRDLVAILQHDWNGPNRDLVLDSLPIGGARGTIEGIAGTPAAGRVFAKTGSMSHVRGLAGYLATQRHGTVTFAFNVDDWNGDYAPLAALRAKVLARIVGD
jgi:D-alanyl-D-alanine carboxypeptidase/D-alanyl-D-alanine-endopeptidase (penicillin-binding protein 4)